MPTKTKLLVICPNKECKIDCMHSKPHEPIEMGKKNCYDDLTQCIYYTGKCERWEG